MSIHCRPFGARHPRRTDEWTSVRPAGPIGRLATTSEDTAPVERSRAGGGRSLPAGETG